MDWSLFSTALMPHVHFPPQEGYRVIIFSRKSITIQGWVQQPNCLLLQFVHVGDLNIKLDEPAMTGPMEEIIGLDGFRELLTFLKFEYKKIFLKKIMFFNGKFS